MADFTSNQQSDWDINKGDYKPDPESTNTYVKKVERTHIVKRVLGIIIYAVVIGIIVYLIII